MPEEQPESKYKRKKAIALRYSKDERAPKVVASGAGEIARRIIELANQNNVPIRKDDSLTDILSQLDVGYEIPPETYQAVAEILAFLYRADEEWRREKLDAPAETAEPAKLSADTQSAKS